PAEPFARVCVGDVDASVPGLEIFGGTDTFKVIGLKRDGSEWTAQELFVDTDKNRGVWVGDVDPNIPGNELYSFGYSTRLVQISGSFSTGWKVKDIWKDTARGHEIRIADIHPDEGVEIATVGYSYNLTIFSQMDVEGTDVPEATSDEPYTLGPGEEKVIKVNIKTDAKMYFSVNDVEDLEVVLLQDSMYFSGTLTIKVKAAHIAEDKTVTLNLQIDYGSGKLTYPMEITIGKDTVAPTVDVLTDSEGNELSDGGQILWNDTLTIQFSEPISEASFNAAKTAGTLKLEWGGKAREEAVFVLSEDRKSISVDLEPMKLAGTVTISLEGLKDDAGLDIDLTPLEVQVKGKMSDDGGGIAWIVIIIVLVIIVIGAAVVYFAFIGKKESGEGDLPPEPKQI
ncbi:MAG: hypothetical protein ACMUHU_07740, partial [Thermoplasmatota archaeon]